MLSLAQYEKVSLDQAFNFGKYFSLIFNIDQILLHYTNEFSDENLTLNLPVMLYLSKHLNLKRFYFPQKSTVLLPLLRYFNFF